MNAGLYGNYAILAPGTILQAPGFPSGLLGPFVRVGQVIADGRGNVAVANTASYNGNIITETYNGTYTISADCSIDVQPIVGLPLGPGGALVPIPFEFPGSISNNGGSAALVLCGIGGRCFAGPTGNVIRVILTRNTMHDTVFCPAFPELSNSISQERWWADPPTGPSRVTVLLRSRKRKVQRENSCQLQGGILAPESFSGTYKVDSLCNATLTYTGSDKATHVWTGTITNNGNGAYVIVNDVGSVIYGSLTKQRPGFQRVF